ncbi:MAG: LysE family translocator [Thermodesulfovibrionales bacterium]|nr:LysE family translocator [Thermodesulfovibrionales bacterium]
MLYNNIDYSMIDSFPFFFTGILFGLVAGISPGPLLALVIAETLMHSRKAGFLVALAPLVTDLPIVLVSVFLLAKFSHSHFILGGISILGALFIGYLAYESISVKTSGLNLQKVEPHSLRKGVTANFLSPHPYLFWIAVGAPTALKAYKVNLLSAFLFILGFYLFLVGSKIFVAFVIDKSRDFLKSRVYVYTIRLLGVVLLIFAVLFLKDGFTLLGLI